MVLCKTSGSKEVAHSPQETSKEQQCKNVPRGLSANLEGIILHAIQSKLLLALFSSLNVVEVSFAAESRL